MEWGERLRGLILALNGRHREREAEVSGALLALLAGEHVLFIGPPGTGKSMLARDVCSHLEDGEFYYYLLTRFTAPEEVFGPLSLEGLQNDEFRRRTEGYLPTADVAFLDEIFKANSSILNSLLTVLNERKYHNGNRVMDVPLHTVFGASNEMPMDGEGLQALYDRFLMRFMVSPIEDEDAFLDVVLDRGGGAPGPTLRAEDIRDVRAKVPDIEVDDGVVTALRSMRRASIERGVYVSDRRWRKILDTLKVAAAAAGAGSVDMTYVPLMSSMLWSDPDDAGWARGLAAGIVCGGGTDVSRLRTDLDDLETMVMRGRALDDRESRLPATVHCYDCNGVFNNLRDLRAHMADSPTHSYMDPFGASVSSGRRVFKKLSRNELLDAMEANGWDVSVVDLGDGHRLVVRQLEALGSELGTVTSNASSGTARLESALDANPWLTTRDRDAVKASIASRDSNLSAMAERLERLRKVVQA